MSEQYRNWVFTLNNYNHIELAEVKSLPLQHPEIVVYICFGKEIGEKKKTPHLQGYIELSRSKKLGGMKRLPGLYRAHFKRRKGTQLQAINYCRKGIQTKAEWKLLGTSGPNYGRDSKFYEYGRPKKCIDAEDWDGIRVAAEQGEFEDIPSKIYIQHHSTLKRIRDDNKKIPDNLNWQNGSQPNEWLYGPTGTGKSHTAREENPEFYYKMNNKWWDAYKGEETVLIEDVGKTHEWMGDFLKIWADRYGFRAEQKGNSTVLRPQKIVVTSNYTIRQLWSDPSIYEPLERRFRLREFTEVYVPDNAAEIQRNSNQASVDEVVLIPDTPPSQEMAGGYFVSQDEIYDYVL